MVGSGRWIRDWSKMLGNSKRLGTCVGGGGGGGRGIEEGGRGGEGGRRGIE